MSWSRLIGLIIGQTAQAAALVLAAYFTGLSIGQFVGGRLASRVPTLFAYGLLELIAAAWTCVVPTLLKWVETPGGREAGEVFSDSSIGPAVWCFLVLLPATVPLGATLPLIVENLATRTDFRRRGTIAYGLNTAGGLIGILLTSTSLMVVVGVRNSGFVAAGLSAVTGLIACITSIRRQDSSPLETSPMVGTYDVQGSGTGIALAAVSGFGILSLEVLYTRMFALIFHNSSYTFGAILAVFLFALCLGTFVASWLGKILKTRMIVIASLSLGGLVLAGTIAVFPRLTGLRYLSFGTSFGAYLVGVYGLAAAFVLPPIALLGMTLPAMMQTAPSGKSVGVLMAVNTISGAAGAIAAGFVFPQFIGLWSAFEILVILYLATGVALLIEGGRKKIAVIVTLMLAVLMTASLYRFHQPEQLESHGGRVVRRWESAYGWIDVVRATDGSLAVRQNIHYRHGSTADAAREYRQGRLPLLLHPRPREVAFLGLGTGLTSAPIVVDQTVESAVIVELIPNVVEAARLLTSENLGVVDHPKVEVRVTDARHYLQHTDRRFDAIVADLFVPWESRAGYLFTVEFYETAQRRLKPDGLFCQWIALYQLGPEQFELIADSFASVFPHTNIWWGRLDGKNAIVALIGSDGPLLINTLRLENRMDRWNDGSSRLDPDMRRASDLATLYLGTWPRNAAPKLNTDEHPWLEFTAPISHVAGLTLSGPSLQIYFDDVLSQLSSKGVQFDAALDARISDDRRRLSIQRLIMFGDRGS
ncbi:MAG: hypothetical protein C0483_10380 [Pirellula sp.]|nr:hypothetical protein [Pirellula sp.]